MQPVYRRYTTTGTKDPVALDVNRNPFDVTVGLVKEAAATLVGTVEYTVTDLEDASQSANAVWTAVTGLSAVTATTVIKMPHAARFIRPSIGTISGGGVQFWVQQGLGS